MKQNQLLADERMESILRRRLQAAVESSTTSTPERKQRLLWMLRKLAGMAAIIPVTLIKCFSQLSLGMTTRSLRQVSHKEKGVAYAFSRQLQVTSLAPHVGGFSHWIVGIQLCF